MKSLFSASLALVLASTAARAQFTDNVVKIGVLNDATGVNSDLSGPGGLVAAKMAVADFGGKVNGTPIEVVYADHQNKPDVGSTIVRQWIDVDQVDAIVDVPSSSVALAVAKVVKDKNKVFIDSAAGTSDLTGKDCTPNTVHWTFDTFSLSNVAGKAEVLAGGKTWFFVSADYSFGASLERDATKVIEANGGKVLGSVKHPVNTADFSSFLLQAQASGAQVIAFANAGGDTINSIKAAHEFGLVKGGQKIAGLVAFVNDVHSLGLETAQGLVLTEAFYWDTNDQTRAFARRYSAQMNGKMPNSVQAGVYAGVLHYLKALQVLKADGDGKAVVDQMKKMPTSDPLFGPGSIHANGRVIHPMYLFEVKKPSESKGEWDLYKLVKTIPGEEAFAPPATAVACPLLTAK